MRNTDFEAIVQKLRRHICELAANIGPRGSTRPEERQAAQYGADQFCQMGYQPQME